MTASMTINELVTVVGGKLTKPDVEACFSSVSTDSRSLQKGELFVALQGPNFNGNKYVVDALKRGAVAAVVSRINRSELTQVVVNDSRKALGQLGAKWRKMFGGLLVGVTGSNGKTTVKEMIASILAECGDVLATKGNLNNDIGVPLTLLNLQSEHQYAVIEMGANHSGEIAYTANLAKPDIAVITNAASAHLEGFGGIKGVAQTKGEIISALSDTGTAILNRDDQFYDYWKALAGLRPEVSFGFSKKACLRTDKEEISVALIDEVFKSSFPIYWQNESLMVSMKLAGQHNVINALAAAAACLSVGCSLGQVAQGLESMRPVSGRLTPVVGAQGEVVIDDSYNANPASCKAALELLSHLEGEKWLVLGAFAELGEQSEQLHREIGLIAREKGVNRLFAVGEEAKVTVEAFGEGATFFKEKDLLIEVLTKAVNSNVMVLVKGSRGQRMEEVVQALSKQDRQKKGEIEHAAISG